MGLDSLCAAGRLPYVNDGFRDMTMAEDHVRHSFFPAFGPDERAIFNYHSTSLSS